MNWRERLLTFVGGVLTSLLAQDIYVLRPALKSKVTVALILVCAILAFWNPVRRALEKLLDIALAACRLAVSKINSSLSAATRFLARLKEAAARALFPDDRRARREIYRARFKRAVVIGAGGLARLVGLAIMIMIWVSMITEFRNKFGANDLYAPASNIYGASVSGACYCPSSAGTVLRSSVEPEPGWQTPAPSPSCLQPYRVSPRYTAHSASYPLPPYFYTTESAPALDCSRARKRRKGRRQRQPCAEKTPPASIPIGGSFSGYTIDDGPPQ
jgi:hypothetical protein